MNKIILTVMLLASTHLFSQVGIGTTNPEGALDIVSTNSGVIVPRVANVAAVAVPVNGMIIYDISSNCIKAYENNAWTNCIYNSTGGNVGMAIASLDCSGVLNNGSLISGLAASGVYSVINYTGGDGSAFSGQLVESSGVTGLTATLTAGNFATDTGALTYTISGTPSSDGTATFEIINIGGQSCSLIRSVNVGVPTNPIGSGSLSGKTCFDIALGNNDENSCGPLSARTPLQSDFSSAATHTQIYTFTPNGIVSNVRFGFVNMNGSSIIAITDGDAGTSISTAVTATVNYSTSLNVDAAALTNSNPLTAVIYVIYNDGANNDGIDKQLKLTANIKDCACCGAYISPTEWKEFLCHNLGADTSLDPHVPVMGLQGAYIQWGKRGPNTTGDSRVDWQTALNNGSLGFAAAPTAADPNDAAISGWSTVLAPNNSWRTTSGAKTANDPCPSGYRVPTSAEWMGVKDFNTPSYTGTSINGSTSYGTAWHYGPNASTKLLTLPNAGRIHSNGVLNGRGYYGYYWSSTERGADAYTMVFYDLLQNPADWYPRSYAFPVRCIAE